MNPTVVALLFCGSCALAQDRIRMPRAAPRGPECPFEAPRLEARDAREVAWAADAIGSDPARRAADLAALRDAHARFLGDTSAEGVRARIHVLAALDRLAVPLPARELQAPDDPLAQRIRLRLLARSPDTGALFFEFQQAPPGGLAWEVLGGALALRGHVPFAAELFSAWQPRLRVQVVEAGRRPESAAGPAHDDGPPAPLEGFPLAPVFSAGRDAHGVAFVASAADPDLPSPGWRAGTTGAVSPVAGAADVESARVRWLAYLARNADPLGFPRRFELRVGDEKPPRLAALLATARQRAQDGIDAVHREFLARRWIPADRGRPELRIEVHDLRGPRAKAAQPLPAIAGVTFR